MRILDKAARLLWGQHKPPQPIFEPLPQFPPSAIHLSEQLQTALTEVAHLRDALAASEQREQAATEQKMHAEARNDMLLSIVGRLVEQHCDWKDEFIGACFYHMFIGIDEEAFEVLEDAGWLREVEREMYVFTEKAKLT